MKEFFCWKWNEKLNKRNRIFLSILPFFIQHARKNNNPEAFPRFSKKAIVFDDLPLSFSSSFVAVSFWDYVEYAKITLLTICSHTFRKEFVTQNEMQKKRKTFWRKLCRLRIYTNLNWNLKRGFTWFTFSVHRLMYMYMSLIIWLHSQMKDAKEGKHRTSRGEQKYKKFNKNKM